MSAAFGNATKFESFIVDDTVWISGVNASISLK